MQRFRDNGETIDSFWNKFQVQCPRCNSCANIDCFDPDNTDRYAPRRFSCTACGSSKDWSGRKLGWESWYCDPYFHYPLWLQAPCCGQTLWAYNLRHLEFIEAFARAKLRERKPNEQRGWSNSSLFSRLPKWIQSGKNREGILKAIRKIRESV
jgi:hypothetical protein